MGERPRSHADRVSAAQRKLKGEKPWRKLKVPRPRYVLVLTRTSIAVLEGGGEAREALLHSVIGPYEVLKYAERDAKMWGALGPSCSSTIVPLVSPLRFDPEEE